MPNSNDRGATAVEFSLIALLLFMLLFGILQFGLAYNRVQGIHAAAREGARLASLGDSVSEAQVISRVQAAAPAFIATADLDSATVAVYPTDHPGEAGSDTWCRDLESRPGVTVKVDLTVHSDKYSGDIPGVGRLSPKLVTEASFLCEQERSIAP